MALDIILREELFNLLRGVHLAGWGSVDLIVELSKDQEIASASALQIYRRGFETAIRAVAVGAGLDRWLIEKGGRDGADLCLADGQFGFGEHWLRGGGIDYGAARGEAKH